jgi:hypothetical protein
MFGIVAPVLPYLGHAPLKGEEKMVMRLNNVRCPLLIKGDAH